MALRISVFLALVASLLFQSAAGAGPQKASDDLAVARPGTSVWINVLANDAQLGPNLRLLKAFKPAHGTAAIENGGIRYTPKAGFEGSDSFRYMAQSAKAQPGEASVNVEVGAGGVALTLKGRVVDDPIPGAVVKASIGGFDFQTVADAEGHYVLDIAALRGDAFVSLVAAGNAPDGAAVKFYSLVGEIARLAEIAGTDGILVRDENNQVQVTNLSTAQYSLLTEANGGAPPGSDQELVPLQQSIDLARLLELAAVIKLVVEGADLPEGTDDVLELISDDTALATFKASVGQAALDLAQAEVEADPEVVPSYRTGAMPKGGYALLPPSAVGTIQPFTGVARWIEMQGWANPSGSGGDVDLQFDTDGAMTWAVVDGDIIITPSNPYSLYSEMAATQPGCESTGWAYNQSVVSTRLHRLQDGDGLDYLEVTDTIQRDFFDSGDPLNCPYPADDVTESSFLRLGFEPLRGELSFADTEEFGQIGLSVYFASEQRWGTGLFTFGATTGVVEGTSLTFSYGIEFGHLLLHMSDGTEYEYMRFQSDGRKGEGILNLAILPDGRAAASYNLAARRDPATVPDFGEMYDNGTLDGLWHSGSSIAQHPNDGIPPLDFHLQLNDDAGHTGKQLAVDEFGLDDRVGIAWGHEGSNFVAVGFIDRNLSFDTRHVAACLPTTLPEDCWQRRRREWIPLARDGDRFYMLETVSFASVPHGPLEIPTDYGQRVNFWEKLPP
jgi:hypothetical protein